MNFRVFPSGTCAQLRKRKGPSFCVEKIKGRRSPHHFQEKSLRGEKPGIVEKMGNDLVKE